VARGGGAGVLDGKCPPPDKIRWRLVKEESTGFDATARIISVLVVPNP